MDSLETVTAPLPAAGVIGAGALGTLFAYELAAAGPVILLVRGAERAAHLEHCGLRVDEGPARRVRVTRDPGALAHAKMIVVATKTYDLEPALAGLRGILEPALPVVSLQNGLDNERRIERALGSAQAVLLAPTSEAAALREPGVAVRRGHGTTALGPANAAGRLALDGVAQLLRAGGFSVETHDPIAPWVWAKAIGNVAINPVGALFDLENGAILSDERALIVSLALAREATAVARAEGIALPFDDPRAYVERLAQSTQHNRSSMWYDLRRGGQTEIDALCGEVCERGARLGVPTPRNCAVRDEVKRRSTPYGSGHG